MSLASWSTIGCRRVDRPTVLDPLDLGARGVRRGEEREVLLVDARLRIDRYSSCAERGGVNEPRRFRPGLDAGRERRDGVRGAEREDVEVEREVCRVHQARVAGGDRLVAAGIGRPHALRVLDLEVEVVLRAQLGDLFRVHAHPVAQLRGGEAVEDGHDGLEPRLPLGDRGGHRRASPRGAARSSRRGTS